MWWTRQAAASDMSLASETVDQCLCGIAEVRFLLFRSPASGGFAEPLRAAIAVVVVSLTANAAASGCTS